MPIDFAALAARFQPRIKPLLKTIGLIFERLGDWLKPRSQQMIDLERLTRPFPVLRFYNGDLTAFLDRSQWGTLAPLEPPRSFMQSLGVGARRFVGGFERIPQAVREEGLIPGILDSIHQVFRAILAAIDRYRTPTPQMFNPNQPRHFLDVIGQGVLLFRAVGTSLPQIQSFTKNVAGVQQAWRDTFGRTGQQMEAAAQGSDRRPTFERLDDLAHWLILGILGIPLLGGLIQTWVNAAVIRAKLKVLDFFQSIEQRVFDLRAMAVNLFAVDLLQFSDDAIRFLYGLGQVVERNVSFYASFGIQYSEIVIDRITQFLRNFSTWMNQLMDFLQEWLNALDRLATLNLLDLAPIPLPGSLTLRDLISENAQSIGDRTLLVIRAIRRRARMNPIGGIADWVLQERLDALEQVILIVTRDSLRRRFLAELADSSAAFRRPVVSFPNLFETFFPGGTAGFAATLQTRRENLEQGIDQFIGAGMQLLGDTGRSFAAAASNAARLDPRRYQSIAATADRVVSDLFSSPTPARTDALAIAFENALIRGGFDLIGEVIPNYVIAMERYWQEQRASDVEIHRDTPTSPHILSRRQRLGRVEAPALVLRLRDRPLDTALVDETVQQFHQALNGIYRTGLEQYQHAR